MTVHRLLRTCGDLDKDDSLHNARYPLHLDVLVIDEASMLDLPLAASLFEALPLSRKLHVVLIGACLWPPHLPLL